MPGLSFLVAARFLNCAFCGRIHETTNNSTETAENEPRGLFAIGYLPAADCLCVCEYLGFQYLCSPTTCTGTSKANQAAAPTPIPFYTRRRNYHDRPALWRRAAHMGSLDLFEMKPALADA